MKKNKFLRLASVMLMLCLITTCAISGTFAKYTTSGTANDTARVAKWGVDFVVTNQDLALTYDAITNPYDMTLSVKSSDTDKLVAPGTAGVVYEFSSTGTPEVSYKVDFTLDETATELIFVAKDRAGASMEAYFPVKFKVEFAGAIVEQNITTEAALAAAVNKCSYVYNVADGSYKTSTNDSTWTAYAGSGAPTIKISWNWVFDGDDVNDTILGDVAASELGGSWTDGTDYNLNMVVEVDALAVQID